MDKMTFETAIKELEEITSSLEAGQLSLDESMKLYERGVKLSAFCSSELEKAQLKIRQLSDITPEQENEE